MLAFVIMRSNYHENRQIKKKESGGKHFPTARVGEIMQIILNEEAVDDDEGDAVST